MRLRWNAISTGRAISSKLRGSYRAENAPMKTSVVLWGASGHAAVVLDALRRSTATDAAFLIDDVSAAPPEQRHGVPVLRSLEALFARVDRDAVRMLIAIGDCDARLRLAARCAAQGLRFAKVVHPGAVISTGAEVGAGCFVAAGAVLGPGAKLGAHCIVNTRASVDHDCVLDEGVHVAPGATLGGAVKVGRGAWIGLGASVRDHVTIGARALIGVGAVVVEDVAENTLAYGCPARAQGSR